MLALGEAGPGRVMLVNDETGEVKCAVQPSHFGNIPGARVTMSPSGRFVASVGWREEHWTLWDAASGEVHRVGASHDGTGACICKVPELGRRLLQDGCPVAAHTAGLRALTFSPCGQRLATGGEDGAVILWDAQTWEPEQRMQGTSGITSLSFSADGARLASGNDGGTIGVWDAATGALLRTMPQPSSFSFFLQLIFSPTDSRILASVGADQCIHLWNVDNGERTRSIEGRALLAFSPDGRTIATASSRSEHELLLFDAESGTLRVTIVDHQLPAITATFSVDGSKLASGSHDGTCMVWDSSTGALLRTINVGGPIFSLAWGRDWVRDMQLAFAMGQHPRLGAGSQVLALEEGVVRMILDRV